MLLPQGVQIHAEQRVPVQGKKRFVQAGAGLPQGAARAQGSLLQRVGYLQPPVLPVTGKIPHLTRQVSHAQDDPPQALLVQVVKT